ncbi:MAG: glycosyltransferase [Nitrososphaerota archaeon]|nr:glycosyltransferase [Nitrososphaerota archaeon]
MQNGAGGVEVRNFGRFRLAPTNPTISVVVPVYSVDRRYELMKLVESLLREDEDDIELIIVIEVARTLVDALEDRLCSAAMNARIVYSPGRLGISKARNLGVAYSSGEIVAFLDDDAFVCRGWKCALLNAFNDNPSIVGVTGRVLPMWQNPEDDWFPIAFYWMIGCSDWTGWHARRYVRIGWGVNMAFRRFVFSQYFFREGFSKGAGTSGKVGPVGDDTDFCLRVTQATHSWLLYDPQVQVLHFVYSYKLEPRSTRRYAFWQGYTESMFASTDDGPTVRQTSRRQVVVDIVTDLVPDLVRKTLTSPRLNLRKLRLLFESSLFFALGYLSYHHTALLRWIEKSI